MNLNKITSEDVDLIKLIQDMIRCCVLMNTDENCNETSCSTRSREVFEQVANWWLPEKGLVILSQFT